MAKIHDHILSLRPCYKYGKIGANHPLGSLGGWAPKLFRFT
jgi:hypothetical protein